MIVSASLGENRFLSVEMQPRICVLKILVLEKFYLNNIRFLQSIPLIRVLSDFIKVFIFEYFHFVMYLCSCKYPINTSLVGS